MRRSLGVGALVAVALLGPGTASPPTDAADPTPPDAAATVIARYRERVPTLMHEQGIPGLAVAVVDGDRPLWVEGFGSTGSCSAIGMWRIAAIRC